MGTTPALMTLAVMSHTQFAFAAKASQSVRLHFSALPSNLSLSIFTLCSIFGAASCVQAESAMIIHGKSLLHTLRFDVLLTGGHVSALFSAPFNSGQILYRATFYILFCSNCSHLHQTWKKKLGGDFENLLTSKTLFL